MNALIPTFNEYQRIENDIKHAFKNGQINNYIKDMEKRSEQFKDVRNCIGDALRIKTARVIKVK